jgi:hypothetical protein
MTIPFSIKKPKLGLKGIKWLRALHLILSVVWLGGAISMNMLRLAWTPTGNGDLYAVDHAIVIIDHWVIVPSAWGALLTGFLESWLTTWGFWKYSWVTVKWIVTVALMLFAPLFQARWAREMESISVVEGLLALQNSTYILYRSLYSLVGFIMIIALAALSIISVLKPWMKKAGAAHSLTRKEKVTPA